MSWQQHQNVEVKGKRACKIRKRGCSSSSSSSLIQKYRFKRAILVGKRAGSTTPVPTWKSASTKSPSLAMPCAEFPTKGSPKIVNKTKEASVSARKLAATLWEINTIPSPQAKEELQKKDKRRKAPRVAKMAHTLPPNLSDPSYSPISEKMDRARTKSHMRRASVVSQKLQVSNYKLGSLDSVGNASLMEIETHSRGKNHAGCVIGIRTRLKDVSNGLATSKELLKVLNRICGLEEQHSSGMALVSALRVELDRARIQVDQLIREQQSNRNEIEYLMRHFAEEKAAWRRKERERIRDAIACIAEELEVEKKLRRQTERLNKKLGKELADTKESLSKATKELESEKRAKEILEQVCDELARGIGEDRATVEELKRESAKVREEVEKEREMLQFADVLREERVQMKLSEAKYHFEEKNAVVEKLRNELEAYLGTKINEENGDGSPNLQSIKELEAYLKTIDFGSCQAVDKDVDKSEVADGEECEADDSADSDLHSIELNMDNNDRSYKWSYACGNDVEGEPKRISVEKENKGQKSISEKISWGSVCLERGSSNSTDWDFGLKIQEKLDGFERDQIYNFASQVKAQDYEDEIKRYRSVKSLRDHILSSNKIAPIQSFSSPTRQRSQSMRFQEPSSTGSPVLKGDILKPKLVGTRGECRTSTS
ncbi:PREDICTED: uncharacterized protein At5g41620 [Theobroma cacao]|uniref:Uncharacterized protein At5g41620 n=1 Tax=Theobroma cacao TaxID=3641 RepID=A0AB32WUD3_THECC|nr:PREDICTED: uncharacterized protein At5g41620 [Theobroma cacao]